MLLATLEHLREYHTYAHIASSYDIAERNIYRGIRWLEDTLIKNGTFSLPGRKALIKSDVEYEVILVDAAETPIERPPKKQTKYYSGKKKRHTLERVTSKIVASVVKKNNKNHKKTMLIFCENYFNWD